MAKIPATNTMPEETISDLSSNSDFLNDLPLNDTPYQNYFFQIEEESSGKRLDAFLAQKLADFSRNRIQDLIKKGHVGLNSTIATSPKQKIKITDTITIKIPPPEDPMPQGEKIPLIIIYEDKDLIIVDKPAGMVVHPAAGNWTGTLVNALIHHCGDSLSGIGGVKRPGIVHRLDKDTSGLLVIAKNDTCHKGLAAQFADHGRNGPLRRAYKALVWNTPARAKGTIQTLLGRSNNNRLKMAVVEKDGREAITHYDIVEAYGRGNNKGEALASLVNCHLETGRTHQIRVHMTHIGCPLIGDPVYGTGYATKSARLGNEIAGLIAKLNRQALHAALLEIEHPRTCETLHFESALPKDMLDLINALRRIE